MRKILTASVAVLALGILAGCGSSGGSDAAEDSTTSTTAAEETTTTTTTPPVAVEAWAEEFCGNFATWTDAIGTASDGVGEGVQVGNAATSQTAIADLYGSSSNATQTLISEIEAGGAPEVEGGEDLIDDLVEAFEAFDAAALVARKRVEALPTSDIPAFQLQIDDLGAQFQKEIEKVDEALTAIGDEYPDADLDAAIDSSCA